MLQIFIMTLGRVRRHQHYWDPSGLSPKQRQVHEERPGRGGRTLRVWRHLLPHVHRQGGTDNRQSSWVVKSLIILVSTLKGCTNNIQVGEEEVRGRLHGEIWVRQEDKICHWRAQRGWPHPGIPGDGETDLCGHRYIYLVFSKIQSQNELLFSW